jgi:hypothetical protein
MLIMSDAPATPALSVSTPHLSEFPSQSPLAGQPIYNRDGRPFWSEKKCRFELAQRDAGCNQRCTADYRPKGAPTRSSPCVPFRLGPIMRIK